MLGRYVDLGSPVADHPLNRGRVLWLYGLPNPYTGGASWRDLCRRTSGPLTNGPQWQATGRGDVGLRLVGASAQRVLTTWTTAPTRPFTVACWFRLTAASGVQSIVGQWGGSSGGPHLLYASGTDLVFGIYTPGYVFHTAAGVLSAGVWYRALYGLGPANTFLYLNGQAVGTPQAAGPSVSAIAFEVGSNGGLNYLTGSVADVSLWAGDLSGMAALDYDLSRRGYPPGGPLRYWSRQTWVLGEATSPPPAAPSNLLLLGVG